LKQESTLYLGEEGGQAGDDGVHEAFEAPLADVAKLRNADRQEVRRLSKGDCRTNGMKATNTSLLLRLEPFFFSSPWLGTRHGSCRR
jgi:hypothetical protein